MVLAFFGAPKSQRQNQDFLLKLWASQMALVVKNPPANAGDIRGEGSIPGSGRSPEGGHATHFSILAWRIPWTEEPDGLQSMGSQKRWTQQKQLSTLARRKRQTFKWNFKVGLVTLSLFQLLCLSQPSSRDQPTFFIVGQQGKIANVLCSQVTCFPLQPQNSAIVQQKHPWQHAKEWA